MSLFGGKATVVLASLLRFNVSWVRGLVAGFAVLPASDDVSTFRVGWSARDIVGIIVVYAAGATAE